jgi:hypothetical protein
MAFEAVISGQAGSRPPETPADGGPKAQKSGFFPPFLGLRGPGRPPPAGVALVMKGGRAGRRNYIVLAMSTVVEGPDALPGS